MDDKELIEIIVKASKEKSKSLNLMNCSLKSLPPEIKELKHLKILNLMNNSITVLPSEIGFLKNLEWFALNHNNIKSLPYEIGYLDKLDWIGVDDNPLEVPPPEIVKSGVESIRQFFKKQEEDEKRGIKCILNYEAKLLVVGQGGVGKTCLINRLINNNYNDKETTTEGIDINKWEIECPEDEKIKIKLNVWDFGGQEIYHATHQFFLTKRSLYVFVWDARQEDEYGRIDYWLRTITTFAGDSPILIVLNKVDERTRELNQKNLKHSFPQIVDFYKVSCKNGKGIDKLKEAIQNVAWELPLIKSEWFESWYKVKRILEENTKNQISYNSYLQICDKHNIEEDEAKTLSSYLHDLGVILNFHKDILLKDTNILNPEWGTNAVYKILDSKIVQERKGVLVKSDLPKIWDRNVYPPDKYAALLRLMTNFELAFPINNNNEYIIPELLSIDEVEYNWNNNNNLVFEYCYDFLSAGIITRFIVLMSDYIIKRGDLNLCWKEGAYFSNEGTEAFVKVYPINRKIVIKIAGDLKREFLSVIRSYFKKIHSTIKHVSITEKIPCNCNPDCDYWFEYNFLLLLEKKRGIDVVCHHSLNKVNLSSLLDGIETKEEREKRDMSTNVTLIEILNKPNMTQKTVVSTNAKSNSSSHSEVKLEFSSEIEKLQDEFYNLKHELEKYDPDLKTELDKIDSELLAIDESVDDPEMVNKSVFKRIGRIVRGLGDPESKIGKAINITEKGIKTVQRVGKIYNRIAPWLGIPSVPDQLLEYSANNKEKGTNN